MQQNSSPARQSQVFIVMHLDILYFLLGPIKKWLMMPLEYFPLIPAGVRESVWSPGSREPDQAAHKAAPVASCLFCLSFCSLLKLLGMEPAAAAQPG